MTVRDEKIGLKELLPIFIAGWIIISIAIGFLEEYSGWLLSTWQGWLVIGAAGAAVIVYYIRQARRLQTSSRDEAYPEESMSFTEALTSAKELHGRGQYEEELAIIDRLPESYSKKPTIALQRGMALANLGRIEEACNALRSARMESVEGTCWVQCQALLGTLERRYGDAENESGSHTKVS